MSKYKFVYTKQAKKDAEKAASAGLKPKIEELLERIEKNLLKIIPPMKNWLVFWKELIPGESTSSTAWCTKSTKKRTLLK